MAKDKKVGEEKFKQINEAHEVLSDPQKRKRYDELGENWKEGPTAQRPSGPQEQGGYATGNGTEQEFHFGGTGFSDFFEQFFGAGGKSGFSFHEAGDAEDPSVRGRDIEGDILVTLDEVLKGAVRDISLQQSDPRNPKTATHHFKVRIPSGIHEGQRIRVPGKGGEGLGGGHPGDLYLRVRLAAHPDFQVRGANLYFELDLAPWEGVIGTRVRVPTLKGPVNLKIPPGTNNGQQLRIPGHGLPKGKDEGIGDLYVLVQVRLPKKINDEERALWEKLGQISAFKPREES